MGVVSRRFQGTLQARTPGEEKGWAGADRLYRDAQDSGVAGHVQAFRRSGTVSDPRPFELSGLSWLECVGQGSRRQDALVVSGTSERQRLAVGSVRTDVVVCECSGVQGEEGPDVDASIVEVPRQRNSRDENARIKSGEPPQQWPEAKRRQKDTQARWTKKHGRSRYCDKNYLSVDHGNALRRWAPTPSARIHEQARKRAQR